MPASLVADCCCCDSLMGAHLEPDNIGRTSRNWIEPPIIVRRCVVLIRRPLWYHSIVGFGCPSASQFNSVVSPSTAIRSFGWIVIRGSESQPAGRALANASIISSAIILPLVMRFKIFLGFSSVSELDFRLPGRRSVVSLVISLPDLNIFELKLLNLNSALSHRKLNHYCSHLSALISPLAYHHVFPLASSNCNTSNRCRILFIITRSNGDCGRLQLESIGRPAWP